MRRTRHTEVLQSCLQKARKRYYAGRRRKRPMPPYQPDSTYVQALPLVVGPAQTPQSSELEVEVVALFDQYRTRLLAYVSAFGITGHDGEEVVQEVFTLALLSSSPGEIASKSSRMDLSRRSQFSPQAAPRQSAKPGEDRCGGFGRVGARSQPQPRRATFFRAKRSGGSCL